MNESKQDLLDAVVARMLGGSVAEFFARHWGQRPLHVPGAGLELVGTYGVDEYLADMVASQPVPYLAVGSRDGARYFTTHTSPEDLRRGVEAGCVAAIKMSKTWHRPDTPLRWAALRALFGSLCRSVSMLYMRPARSEDVDLFLAGPESGLGTHFDTTEVFTLQLHGERRWRVEEGVRIDDMLALSRDPSWHPAREVPFGAPTREFLLRPGDALYVPAYSVHRVTGVGWSVSLSLGLRAFNELERRRAHARGPSHDPVCGLQAGDQCSRGRGGAARRRQDRAGAASEGIAPARRDGGRGVRAVSALAPADARPP
ncbi:JmjC domain-containing protein [Nannocystis pusilla]|uniref:JmjC domain-containing protein n=1 Tax=Nannocystis pusilla TaxID=889268 RepID=UPI003DA26656